MGNPQRVESPLKVNAPQLVLTGIAKFAPDEEINSSIGPLVGKKLFLNPSPPYALEELRISDAQQKLLGMLEKGKRIDELAAETTVPFDEIMRFLYTAAVLGLVLPEDWLPKETEIQMPKAAARRRPPAGSGRRRRRRPPRRQLAPADQDKLRNQLMEVYLRHRKQDAFELLGVAEGAASSRGGAAFPRIFAALRAVAVRAARPRHPGREGGRGFPRRRPRLRRAVERRAAQRAALMRRRKLREEKAAKPAERPLRDQVGAARFRVPVQEGPDR